MNSWKFGQQILARSRISCDPSRLALKPKGQVRLLHLAKNTDRIGGRDLFKVSWQYQAKRFHGHGEDHVAPDAKTIHVTFVRKNDEKKVVEGKVGQNLLRLAQKNDIELEGACECSIACSTCHVILEPDVFDSLPEACEEEEDMLDQAFGLTETSRLGCQIELTEEMDGTTIVLPKATRNFYVDGHVPQPH